MKLAPVGLWVMPLAEISNWSRRTGADICAPPATRAELVRMFPATSGPANFFDQISISTFAEANMKPCVPQRRSVRTAGQKLRNFKGVFGRGSWIRTNDLQYPKLPRYQAALYP